VRGVANASTCGRNSSRSSQFACVVAGADLNGRRKSRPMEGSIPIRGHTARQFMKARRRIVALSGRESRCGVARRRCMPTIERGGGSIPCAPCTPAACDAARDAMWKRPDTKRQRCRQRRSIVGRSCGTVTLAAADRRAAGLGRFLPVAFNEVVLRSHECLRERYEYDVMGCWTVIAIPRLPAALPAKFTRRWAQVSARSRCRSRQPRGRR